MKNYIFGYGSLVNTESRNITGESIFIGQVRIRGLQRGWNVQVREATALGVIESSVGICNGIIVVVSDNELEKYDVREIPTKYRRIEIPKKNIEFLAGDISDGRLWTYVAIDPKLPDVNHPILQSYLDVVLTGFLDFGFDFAKEFVNSTKGWSNLVNDRNQPRYSRALEQLDRKVEIDTLVSDLGLSSK